MDRFLCAGVTTPQTTIGVPMNRDCFTGVPGGVDAFFLSSFSLIGIEKRYRRKVLYKNYKLYNTYTGVVRQPMTKKGNKITGIRGLDREAFKTFQEKAKNRIGKRWLRKDGRSISATAIVLNELIHAYNEGEIDLLNPPAHKIIKADIEKALLKKEEEKGVFTRRDVLNAAKGACIRVGKRDPRTHKKYATEFIEAWCEEKYMEEYVLKKDRRGMFWLTRREDGEDE